MRFSYERDGFGHDLRVATFVPVRGSAVGLVQCVAGSPRSRAPISGADWLVRKVRSGRQTKPREPALPGFLGVFEQERVQVNCDSLS